MERESNSTFQFPPGFRFHPSDEELIVHYLLNKVHSRPLPASVIAEIELYNYNPWDLPRKALLGEDEWYFFSPRDRKYPNGARPNRAAASGYWKATGTDKPIFALSGSKIGVKKALVFYIGRPSQGIKTDWTMNEYRLLEETNQPSRSKRSMRLDEWVLCRVRKKGNMSKNTWEVQESPGKDLPGCLPKIEELPSVHKRTKTEIITDYLAKDCRMLAYIHGHQDLPPIETISGASFQCSHDMKNHCSIHDNGSEKGNYAVTVSSLDNFFSPVKGKQPKENSHQNLFLSPEMVTSDQKGEDLQGNMPNTKSANFNSQNPYQGYIFNPSLSDTIISLQELNESFFTGRFLQS